MYNDDNKNIEIVSGNGKDLDISPVYDNLDIAKPEDVFSSFSPHL